MTDFSASLVREKITFIDDSDAVAVPGGEGEEHGATVVRSNRIFLKLDKRGATEKIVVRAQNMHTTLRLASKIMFDFHRNGLFLGRDRPFDWENQWESVLSAYEKEFNPNIWAAIYINGKPVFKTLTSPFVDVIEQCALLTIDNYDATMDVTESALKQIGRAMRINHSSNVAAVLTDAGDSMRCGIIYRAGGQDTTFSFTAGGGKAENRVVQSLSIAAAFLEGINLRFIVNGLQDKKRRGEMGNVGPEANQLRVGTARLVALDKGIVSFEEIYDVKYRPLKPQFFDT